MNMLRYLIWQWRMRKIRSGMTADEVVHRLGLPTGKITTGECEIWNFDLGRIKDMQYSIRVAFRDGRVSQVYLGMEACGDAAEQASLEPGGEPFMEHPSGEHENAIAAMEGAICRLRALPDWNKWITFCAQGEDPAHPGTIKFAEVRLLGNKLVVDEAPLNLTLITQKANAPSGAIRTDGTDYSITAASPHDVAILLDSIFQHHFGIRPFADEENDYAVGAEW
jgi:hypothetical protein